MVSMVVNDDRHDPYPTPQIKDNPVEPQINKNTKGIGGDRKPEDPLKDEGELTQTALQKTLLDADPDRKDNEFPITSGVKGVIDKKEILPHNTESYNPYAPVPTKNETYSKSQKEITSMYNPRTSGNTRRKGNATVSF